MMQRLTWLAGTLALGSAACGHDVEGTWRGTEDVLCAPASVDRVEFVVDEDLLGRGDVCACTFDFELDDRGDNLYRADLAFQGTCFASNGKYDCQLERDDQVLDCHTLGRYERIGD
jgi:hypothetical protein